MKDAIGTKNRLKVYRSSLVRMLCQLVGFGSIERLCVTVTKKMHIVDRIFNIYLLVIHQKVAYYYIKASIAAI